MSKQQVSKKRMLRCERIVGKPILSAFMNGILPKGVALAWTGPKDAYFVNFKKKTCKEYVRDGKFLMKRSYLPVRVRMTEKELSVETKPNPNEFPLLYHGKCPGCAGDSTNRLTNNIYRLRTMDRYFTSCVEHDSKFTKMYPLVKAGRVSLSEADRLEFCPYCCGSGPFHNQYCLKLRAVAENECPGCVNEKLDGVPVRGLTHNQFCDSLKIEED